MSKFNTIKKTGPDTVNQAGGQAHSQSAEMELASMLLTSFVEDTFYEKTSDFEQRLSKVIDRVDPLFAAKAAIYARDVIGMRSVTHLLASNIAPYVSGKEWGSRFYDKVVVRPDDMTEILACYMSMNRKDGKVSYPNSMKKGFASAFSKFDGYQLAKYKGSGHTVKLVDIVNLVHPVPTEKNSEALTALINNELKSTGTWESKLSEAGSGENVQQAKADVWSKLIGTGKIGQMALLKNLRNIILQSPESVTVACRLLTEDKRVKGSRILPFRYLRAYEEVKKMEQTTETREVLVALSSALDRATSNVPVFSGRTLVALDVSQSMTQRCTFDGDRRPYEFASLFASLLLKSNKCDLMLFDGYARYQDYDPTDSVLRIRDSFNFTSGSTCFRDIFNKANKSYDRIIILSDMMAWVGVHTPVAEVKDYKKKFGCDPYIYTWDFYNSGTMQFPERNTFALTGFSEKVFDVMSRLEEGGETLVDEIKKVII